MTANITFIVLRNVYLQFCSKYSNGDAKYYLMTANMLVFLLLSHFLLIHSFHLHLLYQPYLGLCQATCVQSHQRQPTSAVVIAACEVQVSAADSQTVRTVATGVSKPRCCRLTLTFTMTSDNLSLYTTLLLYWSTLLTSWLHQLANSRGLYCRRC